MAKTRLAIGSTHVCSLHLSSEERRENVQMSKQTIISNLTNDAKLTAQIDAANDAKSYACCKTGSN